MPLGAEHPGNDYHPLGYGDTVDAWWPFTFEGNPNDRSSHYMEGVGRLKAGVKPEQAQAEMNGVLAQIKREHGNKGSDWRLRLIPLYQEIVGPSERMLLVLLGAVGLVLLIACVNAANLLLARATARQREIAVRSALGAPRSRLIRQMLTESLLIALLGGGLGVAVALGGVRALVSLLPADFPRADAIHVNAPVLVFTVLVAIATGFLFGLVPALQVSRTDLQQGLREGCRTSTSSGRHVRLRSVLVVAEVSLACVLLIGAGLMLRSLVNLLRMDPGFRPEHLLTASISLPATVYKSSDAVAQFYNQLAANLNSIPGVRIAGVGTDLPWTGYDENVSGFTIEGKKPPPNEHYHARYHAATPGYFRAMGIPLVRGRFFTDGDNKDAPMALIINRSMAESYWRGEDPVGRRMSFSDTPKEKDWMTIVGVVGDVKDKPNSSGAEHAFWWPVLQQPYASMSIVVRADSDPQQLLEAVRREVNRLDSSLALGDVRLMDQIADSSISTPRFASFLVGLFAALAIVLAAIGIYGVISYSASQRTHEFGLRMALGAARRDVLRLVISQGIKLTLAGVALGVVAALALARLLQSLIYEVSAADPLTFAMVATIVIIVALLACYVPARRATKSDPTLALRAE
jgi:predicted permease